MSVFVACAERKLTVGICSLCIVYVPDNIALSSS